MTKPEGIGITANVLHRCNMHARCRFDVGSPRGRRRCNGWMLVEWLMATAIGAIVSAATLSVLQSVRMQSAYRIDDAQMRLDGRVALDLLRTYARLAGYGVPNGKDKPVSMAGPPGRTGRPHFSQSAPEGIAFRYRADAVSAWRAGPLHRPSDCTGKMIAAAAVGRPSEAVLTIRHDSARSEPGLYCAGGIEQRAEPLVDGVVDMQFRYWVEGRQAPMRAVQLTPDDWRGVSGINVCVTTRGRLRQRAPVHRGCDGEPQPVAADGRRRATFHATIALRNRPSPVLRWQP